jgi:ADP-ribosyl-[dinitrogen reductase] hydrolase
MSSNGTCFDIGGTVSDALGRFKLTGHPVAGSTDPQSAGNGSLMRLAPVVLFYHPDIDAVIKYAGESSRTTHGAEEAVAACQIFARYIASALDGNTKSGVLSSATTSSRSERLNAIASAQYRQRSSAEIRGTGYVVDCLEAALWCFERTDSFRDAVLEAANLGDDADTTAAVCGQIAGAYYGVGDIPKGWLDRLALREEILELADGLLPGAT